MLQESVCQLSAVSGPGPGAALEVQLLAEELRGRALGAAGDLEGAQRVLAEAFEAAASAGLQVGGRGRGKGTKAARVKLGIDAKEMLAA